MPKSRPPYPAEFRQQIVELARVGRTPAELSREFGCSAQAVANWVAQAAVDASKPLPGKNALSGAEREELARLRRENRPLELERDLLSNRLRGAPRPCGIETLAAYTAEALGPEAASFLEAYHPVSKHGPGDLRTRLWWHCGDPV